MTGWRPPQTVLAKVVGLVEQQGRWLLARVEADDGSLIGYRPLGGRIEFGETREAALLREFSEELGSAITITSPWLCFENIFSYEGSQGHELVFAARMTLLDDRLLKQENIAFQEADGTPYVAQWLSLPEVEAQGVPLFPVGLAAVLRNL